MNHPMKSKLLALALGLMASAASHAAITCSLSSSGVTTTYTAATNTSATGSITLTCNRPSGDTPSSPTYFISLDQGEAPNGRDMTRQNGTDKLRYAIYRNSGFTGSWTTGTGRAPGATQAGGLNVVVNLTSSTTFSTTIPFYFRINAGINRPAGIYDDVTSFAVYVSRGGALLSQTPTTLNTSIVAQCFFNSTAAVALSYTSFSATPQIGTASYSLSCTLGTGYAMAVTPTSGTLVGLPYTLALSAASGTGTAFPQAYSVTATVPANQSGTCALGSCTATQTHQIVITY